jgi:putative endonuclease
MTATLSSRSKGAAGEQEAAEFLVEKGWTILERNFRWKGGEIDIIAEKGDVVAFVEVKAWQTLPQGELEHSVDLRKQGRIVRAARLYLSRKPRLSERHLRFDVIFLALAGTGIRATARIEHIENAFGGGID